MNNQDFDLLPVRRLGARDLVKRPEQTVDGPAVQASVHALCIAGEELLLQLDQLTVLMSIPSAMNDGVTERTS